MTTRIARTLLLGLFATGTMLPSITVSALAQEGNCLALLETDGPAVSRPIRQTAYLAEEAIDHRARSYSFRQVAFQEEVSDSGVMPEDVMPGDVMPKAMVPNAMVPNAMVPNTALPEEMAPEKIVPGELVPEELVPGELVPEELVFDDEIIYDDDGFYDDGQPDLEHCQYVPSSQFWIRADYLSWWTNGNQLPALITTGLAADAVPGALGQPGTNVLFGGGVANSDTRSSYRMTLGYWGDTYRVLGMEADYFDLGGASANFSQTSNGSVILARPFFDVISGSEGAQLIAHPVTGAPGLGVVGTVTAHASDYFESVGVRMRRNLRAYTTCQSRDCIDFPGCPQCNEARACGRRTRTFRLDMIGGYRYYRLNDGVTISENTVLTEAHGVVPAGVVIDVRDSFHATNEFNGGELGLLADYRRGRWSMELLAKFALGNNRRTVLIDGRTVTMGAAPGDTPVVTQGGLLALPTNMGRHIRNDFTIIPQFGAELGYQLTHGMRFFAGYNLLYWSQTARAGDHIDTNVDQRNIPPPMAGATPSPAFTSRDTAFWAQGLNLGVELRY